MTEEKVKLIVGSLLHDIGKVIYRDGTDRRNHSVSGYEYLKKDVGIEDKEILECVYYHHASLLKYSKLEEKSLAYIVYIADNIAAFADRRNRDDSGEKGFELSVPLESVFNILNGNSEKLYYSPGDIERKINYPISEKKNFSEEFYQKIKLRITDNLRDRKWDDEYVNSLLAVMEANLSYMPSSTSKAELGDISLYDHVKLTAAIATCIYDYLNEKGLNYKDTFYEKENEFYEKEVFVLCSLDISGIQKFIYTITSKNALKTLRARSFYLEIMMEHMIDLLLEQLKLSRANLIYSGGGHCYLLLPRTQNTLQKLQQFQKNMKKWFLEYYRTELYISYGYVTCNANMLRNVPKGSYSEMFRNLGIMISENKQKRYTAEEILLLNHREEKDYSRECKVCKSIGQVDEEGVCSICRKIESLSKEVLYSDFFTVIQGTNKGLPLPGGFELITDTEETLRKRMELDNEFVRTYTKNKMYMGKHLATQIWVGDYSTGDTFEEFAKKSSGINRLGVLRADVDNLGQAFVSGFENTDNGNKYVTLSRTATLSRQLSTFFKFFIRNILEQGEYDIDGLKGKKKRNATIIYSGGDDVFIVGAWNEIIELAIDLRRKFSKYTQGTLSISAGIGVYDPSYPIIAIAKECGEMEDESKRLPGKNAITIFEDGEKHQVKDEIWGEMKRVSDGTYSWDEFEYEVIEEKYRTLQTFLRENEDRGMSFLYRMMELVRKQRDKINFARFVYLLARLEPIEEGEAKIQYQEFSKKMFQWIRNEKDCRQLKTAMNLYAYMNREKEELRDED